MINTSFFLDTCIITAFSLHDPEMPSELRYNPFTYGADIAYNFLTNNTKNHKITDKNDRELNDNIRKINLYCKILEDSLRTGFLYLNQDYIRLPTSDIRDRKKKEEIEGLFDRLNRVRNKKDILKFILSVKASFEFNVNSFKSNRIDETYCKLDRTLNHEITPHFTNGDDCKVFSIVTHHYNNIGQLDFLTFDQTDYTTIEGVSISCDKPKVYFLQNVRI